LPVEDSTSLVGEIELRECRLEFFFEIGAQRIAPLGILAFGLIANPAIEFGEKLAGMKMLVRAIDSVGSGHVSLSRSRACRVQPTYRDTAAGESARWALELALLKPAGIATISANSRHSTGCE